ncbi:MAG TPA: efflux RND transporter periplasmic adaptor subunit [Xanthobacteraceae bacterium]|nr:efflux RND transporter periplasmic adaptor subunit [Xanthobacteraceae bacterium]
MDERTRTDDELAPNLRRTAPEPIIKSRPHSKVRIGIGLIVVLLLALGAYQIGRWAMAPHQAPGRFVQGAAQSVGASTAALNNVPVVVNALGTVTPLATVTVQSQISGYLVKVPFQEGQMVRKGDLLAQVDDRPYVILKAQYEGQLAHDQGLLSQAQMDLKRYQTLVAQNSIAKQQAEDQVFIVQQYEGTVKQDQGLIDAQTLNIAYCHIVSPVTGRIGLRLVDAGNYVQPNSATGIAVVTQIQPITVIFTVPEDDLPDIMPELNSGAKLQVTVFDRANVKKLAVGTVSAVDSQINTTTGTVNVRAQFENTDNALFPNQFVNAQLLVKTLQNAVTVPTAAIQRGAPGATPGGAMGTYVYLINANNTVSVKQVTVGPLFTDANNVSMTSIVSGLSAGDRVVTDGTDRLRDGMHVSVSSVDNKPVAPAPGGSPSGNGHKGGRAQRQGTGTGTSQ